MFFKEKKCSEQFSHFCTLIVSTFPADTIPNEILIMGIEFFENLIIFFRVNWFCKEINGKSMEINENQWKSTLIMIGYQDWHTQSCRSFRSFVSGQSENQELPYLFRANHMRACYWGCNLQTILMIFHDFHWFSWFHETFFAPNPLVFGQKTMDFHET